MALLLTGHPRSGTTMLNKICNRHPDIAVTRELGSFQLMGVSKRLYTVDMLGHLWKQRRRPVLDLPGENLETTIRASRTFALRFLRELRRLDAPLVFASDVETILRPLFPEARIVGDKHPAYAFNLGAHAFQEGATTVVIYRDGRDVTASFLDRIRHHGWKKLPVVRAYDTLGKIARLWVSTIDQMLRLEDHVHILRYEDLVRNPREAFEQLGHWLDVDPGGFPEDLAHADSIGRHRRTLTAEEQAAVMQVAGPTLERLGYV